MGYFNILIVNGQEGRNKNPLLAILSRDNIVLAGKAEIFS